MAIRMTYQTKQVLISAKTLKHATNLQILSQVQYELPDLTATTVHRITQRLVLNNLLAYGPEINGSIIIDANTKCHDHFVCNKCYRLQDIIFTKETKDLINTNIRINNGYESIVVNGKCDRC